MRLDIEAELGFVVGALRPASASRWPLADADEHLFGVVLLNDWSARDLQAWEYVPLGPFLGKSFATSISPWVVTTDALRAARVPLPGQDPEPLPYLRGEPTDDGAGTAYGLDLHVEVDWNGTVVSRPEFRDMYWSPAQMVAHMTVNGASLRSGDLFGSGTISGPEKGTRGCFLELTWSGTEPLTLDDGSTRTFLEDGDTITLRATAPGADGDGRRARRGRRHHRPGPLTRRPWRGQTPATVRRTVTTSSSSMSSARRTASLSGTT